MIVKNYEPAPTEDRFQKAGDAAELQMAHYLRRAFGENDEVKVLNNLRLERGGEVAQIDHLIIHRYGFIIIESKSVISTVRINNRQEWSRLWNGRWSGMASPILQARRQEQILMKLLDDHASELRGKLLGLLQTRFGGAIVDVVTAISDQGIIEAKSKLPEVKKADQVPDYVEVLLACQKKGCSILANREDDKGSKMSAKELERVTAFLLSQHKEAPRQASTPAQTGEAIQPTTDQTSSINLTRAPRSARTSAPQVQQKAPKLQCTKCSSANISIRYGFNYYIHCHDCGGQSPLKPTCGNCSSRTKIRKEGKSFYAECVECHVSDLLFTNP